MSCCQWIDLWKPISHSSSKWTVYQFNNQFPRTSIIVDVSCSLSHRAALTINRWLAFLICHSAHSANTVLWLWLMIPLFLYTRTFPLKKKKQGPLPIHTLCGFSKTSSSLKWGVEWSHVIMYVHVMVLTFSSVKVLSGANRDDSSLAAAHIQLPLIGCLMLISQSLWCCRCLK